jgi:chemotaxis response regulator CheB
MPREAIEIGATHEVAPLNRLRERALARVAKKEVAR